MMMRRNELGVVVAAVVLAGLGGAALGEGPLAVWNANVEKVVEYQPLAVTAKVDDWVYFDSRKLHPTQFCLGYREVEYKAKLLSGYSAEVESRGAEEIGLSVPSEEGYSDDHRAGWDGVFDGWASHIGGVNWIDAEG